MGVVAFLRLHIEIIVVLAAVVLASRLGGVFGFPPDGISTFWPPNAILLAALLTIKDTRRTACLLLAFPAYVAAELWSGYHILGSLFLSAANCIEVATALWLILKFSTAPFDLSRLRQLFILLLVVTLVVPIVGIFGAFGLALSGEPFASTFVRWVLADFVGYLVFTPLVLTLPAWRDWMLAAAPSAKAEAALVTTFLIVFSIAAYGQLQGWSQSFHGGQFLPIPAMLWMALRFGPKGAAVASVAISLIALSYAINGYGPFSDLTPEQNVASLQFFITSIVVATLLVAVLLRERDDTLKLLLEKDQHQKEERYRALVDLATDGIMILDVDTGNFIEANSRAARIFGFAPEDLVGTLGPSELSPEFQPDGRRSDAVAGGHIMDALQGNFPTFEWTHKNADGQRIPCEVSLARFPDRERQLIRASILDISARKDAERHRLDLESRLAQSQKLEAIGQMTGGVAHDFNNLLSVILGNLELVLEENADKEQIRMIETAIGATYKGAELTKNMLNFARRANLRPTLLNLSDIVVDMDNWLSRTIPASIRVEKSLQPDLWQIEADLSTTESALLNLMINGRDAMLAGGVITLETSNIILDEGLNGGTGEGLKPGSYVLLAVSDTGIGIPPENIEQVFDPFFSTKGPAAGSGLGLSMVHGFMKQSGGIARIYSEVGVGTTVKLYFKASRESKSEEEGAKDAPSVAQKSIGRILVAEDQDAVNDLLVRILRKEGHEVVPAKTGDEALETFQLNGSFDLLVTDIVMPGRLQGPELAREIRRLSPEMPVVFMSGYAREATIHGNGLRESDIRLMKPVSKKDLIRSVNNALSAT